MSKLAISFVGLALVGVSFIGCDAGPAEPESSDATAIGRGQDEAAFKWYLYDSDSESISETVYLECLNETVLVDGDYLWWIWNDGTFEDDRLRDAVWFAPYTTMVGPSGTWTVLRQAGPEPGQWGVKHDIGQVTWENVATGGTLHTFGEHRSSTFSDCRLTGPS